MEYLNDYKKFTNGKESLPEHTKNFTENGIKTLPNNNTNNKNTFIRPSVETITAYANELGFVLDASHFYDHYEARGWMIGKNPMKDWKAAVRTWKRNSSQFGNNPVVKTTQIKLK
jgi:hypothetical protein